MSFIRKSWTWLALVAVIILVFWIVPLVGYMMDQDGRQWVTRQLMETEQRTIVDAEVTLWSSEQPDYLVATVSIPSGQRVCFDNVGFESFLCLAPHPNYTGDVSEADVTWSIEIAGEDGDDDLRTAAESFANMVSSTSWILASGGRISISNVTVVTRELPADYDEKITEKASSLKDAYMTSSRGICVVCCGDACIAALAVEASCGSCANSFMMYITERW
jgi:hypothetical protein